MFTYVLRRLMVAVPMLLGAMSIVFFAMRILPGDPCVAMMGDQATSAALADCSKNLGLNRPLIVQYVDFIWRSVRMDFGTSLRQGYPVSEYIGRMFPHTLILVLASAVVAALVGVPIGILSALKRRNPLIDYPLRNSASTSFRSSVEGTSREPSPCSVPEKRSRIPATSWRR
jgi:peptide/nickel transport system permease protein